MSVVCVSVCVCLSVCLDTTMSLAKEAKPIEMSLVDSEPCTGARIPREKGQF